MIDTPCRVMGLLLGQAPFRLAALAFTPLAPKEYSRYPLVSVRPNLAYYISCQDSLSWFFMKQTSVPSIAVASDAATGRLKCVKCEEMVAEIPTIFGGTQRERSSNRPPMVGINAGLPTS